MPPSPAQTARIRAEIFEHAGRLFRLRGYAGTSIDDIMLAAGLTRGAFYAHFKSKDDLFAERDPCRSCGCSGGCAARMRRPRRARRLSRQGRSGGQRARLHPGGAGRRCRARLPPRPLGYANVLHAVIGELAARPQPQARRRRDGGGDPGGRRVAPRPRERRPAAQRLAAALRAAGGAGSAAGAGPASFAKAETIQVTPESRWRSSFQTRCTITRWSGLSRTNGAFFWIQAISRSGLANLLSCSDSTTAFSPASIFSTPAGAAQQLERDVFSRYSASAGSGPKRSTSSAAKASISAWVVQARRSGGRGPGARRGRRRTPRGSAPACRD